MKCSVHPTYKVIRKPTADCEQCRFLWEIKQMTPEQMAAGREELERNRVATPESIREWFNSLKK